LYRTGKKVHNRRDEGVIVLSKFVKQDRDKDADIPGFRVIDDAFKAVEADINTLLLCSFLRGFEAEFCPKDGIDKHERPADLGVCRLLRWIGCGGGAADSSLGRR
jgi:hypothetical protein